MLSANEGKIINTVTIRSLKIAILKTDLVLSLSGSVRTSNTPKMPKAIEEQIKIRVAIFCIVLV